MVHTAIIAFILISMMLLLSGDKKEVHKKEESLAPASVQEFEVPKKEFLLVSSVVEVSNSVEGVKAIEVTEEVEEIVVTPVTVKNSSIEVPKTIEVVKAIEVEEEVKKVIVLAKKSKVKVIEIAVPQTTLVDSEATASTIIHSISIPTTPTTPSVPKVPNVEFIRSKPKSIEISKNEIALQKQLKEVHRLASIGEKEAYAYEANTKSEIAVLEAQLAKVQGMAMIGENQARSHDESTKKTILGLEERLSKHVKRESELEAQLAKVQGMASIGEKQARSNEANTKKTITNLETQLAKVNKMVKVGEVQAKAYKSDTERQIENLEVDLSKHVKSEKVLAAQIEKFPTKIDELVGIAEEISQKAEAEFKKIFSKNEALENNLTMYGKSEVKLVDLNVELERKVAMSQKELEKALKNEELLAQENKTISFEVVKLLGQVKEATDKVIFFKKNDNQEIQRLLFSNKSLESNLTAELEKEKKLVAENSKLKLELAIFKEEAEKVAAEAKAKE